MRRLIWALFGNDDDGIYGERSGEVGYDPAKVGSMDDDRGPLITPKWFRAVCWWFRNPFHNLCFHAWRKPDGWFINCAPLFYIGHRPCKPLPGGVYTQDQLDWLAKRDGAFGFALFRGYP